MSDWTFWKNKHNGQYYSVIDNDIISATNGEDGERMVLYQDSKGKKYIRKHKEFMEKFVKVNIK